MARLLAHAILPPTQNAVEYLEIFAEELTLEIRSREADRDDSRCEDEKVLRADSIHDTLPELITPLDDTGSRSTHGLGCSFALSCEPFARLGSSR